MINRFDQRQMYEASLNACLFAVRDGFAHLSIRDILNPPREWLDAALARQVVMHLMVHEFEWPKRRVAMTEERSREAINRGLRTIDVRLETPSFAAHYRRIALQARALVLTQTADSRAA